MTPLDQKLWIVGADEVAAHRGRITHLVSITNPGAPSAKPDWFNGAHLQLWFGDVMSEADAKSCGSKAPAKDDILKALEFYRAARQSPAAKVLIHCSYGASRSPALAYVLVADQLGSGREAEALDLVLKIRPNAVPNRLVIQLGDELLERHGAMLDSLRRLYRKINEELSRSKPT